LSCAIALAAQARPSAAAAAPRVSVENSRCRNMWTFQMGKQGVAAIVQQPPAASRKGPLSRNGNPAAGRRR
jgi:hypothetical protein